MPPSVAGSCESGKNETGLCAAGVAVSRGTAISAGKRWADMQDILALASANLLTPMILRFALGLLAALDRSELTIPEAMAKGM